MTDTAPAALPTTTARVRGRHEHALAQARVRSLSARPVGPMKVLHTHGHQVRTS